MNCFPCFSSQKSRKELSSPRAEPENDVVEHKKPSPPPRPSEARNRKEEEIDTKNISSQNFTFREVATATKNFRQECLIGEGGFGRVYKGTLPGSGQVVAVKQLDRNGLQGNKEFLVEVSMLSLLHHENLVNLIGYCADGDQRLLVYEFMAGGSLEDHLLDIGPEQKPLDWLTRMRIAYGAAQGLEYLHDKANPPVIYRDLKSSNILLDENFNPKLSDFGLAKLGPAGDSKMHISSRVMGTYGHCAPEYTRSGDLTVKSDVFSFGVVLLELITGRRAIDPTKPTDEQNLVAWAQTKFRNPKLFPTMADPLLEGRFPEKGLNQAVAVSAMCLQEEASVRPLMSDVVATLSFLLMAKEESVPVPPPESTEHRGEVTSNEEDCKSSDKEGEQKVDHLEKVASESKRSDLSSSSKSSMSSDGSMKSRDKSFSNGRVPSMHEGSKSLSHKSSGRSVDGFNHMSDTSSPRSSQGGSFSQRNFSQKFTEDERFSLKRDASNGSLNHTDWARSFSSSSGGEPRDDPEE